MSGKFIILELPSRGRLNQSRIRAPEVSTSIEIPCDTCYGTGRSLFDGESCPDCLGRARRLVARRVPLEFSI